MNCQVPYHTKGEFQLMMKVSFHDSHRTFGRAGSLTVKGLVQVPRHEWGSQPARAYGASRGNLRFTFIIS